MGGCIGIGIVIFPIVVLIIWLSSYVSDRSKMERERDKIREINSSRKPYDTVRVEELEDDYEANSLSARRKYNGRKLRLIGRLSNFSKRESPASSEVYSYRDYFYKTSGGWILTLGRNTECFFTCDSYFAKEELDKRILELRKGQMMSIEGVWIDKDDPDSSGHEAAYRLHGLYYCESWSVIG